MLLLSQYFRFGRSRENRKFSRSPSKDRLKKTDRSRDRSKDKKKKKKGRILECLKIIIKFKFFHKGGAGLPGTHTQEGQVKNNVFFGFYLE